MASTKPALNLAPLCPFFATFLSISAKVCASEATLRLLKWDCYSSQSHSVEFHKYCSCLRGLSSGHGVWSRSVGLIGCSERVRSLVLSGLPEYLATQYHATFSIATGSARHFHLPMIAVSSSAVGLDARQTRYEWALFARLQSFFPFDDGAGFKAWAGVKTVFCPRWSCLCLWSVVYRV